jgi:hypothetical protein
LGAHIATIIVAGAAALAEPRAAPPSPFVVAGHEVKLAHDDRSCWIATRPKAGGEWRILNLDMRPPCYLLMWRGTDLPAPDAQGASDGVPFGGVGTPMAYRYRSADGVIALAIIGDPVSPTHPDYQEITRAGDHCAVSLRGLRLHGTKASLSPKRPYGSLKCVERPIEEKDFWILAHDGEKAEDATASPPRKPSREQP